MPFIADNPLQGGFVPDTAIDTPKPKEKTIPISEHLLNAGKGVMNAIGGVVEPVLQQATGMVGKTAGDIAGLAGIVGDATGIAPNDPSAVQAAVRQGLTYQPQSQLGASPNNLLNSIPQAIGNGINHISPSASQDPSSLGGMVQNGVREAVPNALNIMAIKAMPVASNAIGNYIDRSLTALAGKQSANSVIDATNKAATDAGYKIPTATINPSAVNTTIEGIASKLGTAQKASLDNAPITDSLARQAANLPANTPLTDVTLKTAKAPFNKVYEDMKAAGPFQVDSQYPVSSLSPDITANAISGADAINSIKTLRNKASTLWDGWKSSGNPETLDSAIAHTGAANDLESLVGRNLETANPELLQQFKDARTSLAKINTVQDALIQGGGSIDAKVLGNMTQSGIPLTDELKVIGDFANNHPQLVQTLKKVGSPGVNNLRALTTSALSIGAGGAGFTLGGPAGAIAGAALPMALESLAKRAALRLTTPSYTPGMAAQGLPIIPPAVAASMIAGSNNRNLTNVPTNILQNILRNPSQQLVGNDIALNKLLGGNNETISARLGKSRNTSVMSAALANELDRIDPGHIDRALAAQQQGQP